MKKIKDLYKTFFNDFSFTLLCSTTIIIGVFLIYLIFAAMLFNSGITALAADFFGMILIIVCLSLILGLISPFVYSLFACNGVVHSERKNEVSYKSFLKTYLIGTRYPFKGQLQIWNTLLRSFLIYMVFEMLSLLVIYMIALEPNSEFKPLLDAIQALNPSSNSYFTELSAILEEHSELIKSTSLLTNFFGLFFGTYYFIHTIAKNTLRYFLAPTLMNAPNRLVTYVYRMGIREHKKEYLGGYYKTLWPLTVLYVVSFALSYFLIGYLGPKSIDINVLSLTSLFISVAVLIPFLPLVFNYHESIWPKFSYYFIQLFVANATRELNQLKKDVQNNNGLTKENINLAEKNIEKIKEAFDTQFKEQNNSEPEEKNREKADDSSSNNSNDGEDKNGE